MTLSTTQLSAISRLFSSAVFKEMAKKGRSPLFTSLVNEANFVSSISVNMSVGDVFEKAFSILKTTGCRDEYVYRAALTHRVLMGTHSLNTASMLTEFRAGQSKADLAILNGTATVYEIKSERDTLARLPKQLKDYQKVFARAYVICSERHVKQILKLAPTEVGVLSLSSRYQISTIRDAISDLSKICPNTVLNSLRVVEAVKILEMLGIAIPETPNTKIHALLTEYFSKLNPIDLHTAMVHTLKRTRSLDPLSQLVDQLPRSLHAAALTFPIRLKDHEKLVSATSTSMKAAAKWA